MSRLTEHQMQKSVIAERDIRANQDPRWGLLMAFVNGQYRPGQRMEPGLTAGAPDLILCVPRAAQGKHPAYHGAFFELKTGRNKPSAEQERILRLLIEQGYYVGVYRDDPAVVIETVLWYLGDSR